MEPRIFISYRRDDSAAMAARIHERLRGRFGPESVFIDFDAIPVGIDFRAHLHSEIDRCDLFIVVIGDRWLEKNDAGIRRIDEADDYVRLEIEAALSRRIPVIPLLVGKAPMPALEQLPASLADLTYRNGLAIDPGADFQNHIGRLIHNIERVLAAKASPRPFWRTPAFAICIGVGLLVILLAAGIGLRNQVIPHDPGKENHDARRPDKEKKQDTAASDAVRKDENPLRDASTDADEREERSAEAKIQSIVTEKKYMIGKTLIGTTIKSPQYQMKSVTEKVKRSSDGKKIVVTITIDLMDQQGTRTLFYSFDVNGGDIDDVRAAIRSGEKIQEVNDPKILGRAREEVRFLLKLGEKK